MSDDQTGCKADDLQENKRFSADLPEECAIPSDYFELRCAMLDQFLLALLELGLDVPTAVATSLDAMTGRIHRSTGDAAAVYGVALGLLARHAPDALLPKYAEKVAWLASLRPQLHGHGAESEWLLDDLRWIAGKAR